MKKIYLSALITLLAFTVDAQSSPDCFVQIQFNSSGNLCFGNCNGTATAFPVGTGPYTFSWSNGATTQNLSGLCAGSYTLTVTDLGAGNVTCVGNGSITCPALLIVNITPSGNTATAIASGGTFPYTYLWSPGGQTTMTATGLSTGTYTCVVTDANGCTASATVNISITGFNDNSFPENNITIYPNPVSDAINIEMKMESKSTVTISVLNLLGETMYGETLTADKFLNQVIDVSGYADGVYVISIQTPENIITKRIVKN